MKSSGNLKPLFMLFIILSTCMIAHGDDSQIRDFFKSGVTFGFKGEDGLYCYPEYKKPRVEPTEDFIRPRVYQMYEEKDRKDVFDLPRDYIENHIADRVGDTVMVIFAGNSVLGVIDTIVYYWPELEEGVVCVVRSLGTEIRPPGYPPNIMILRKEKFYTGPFIPYAEYRFVDYSYLDLKDSLKATMIKSFVEDRLTHFEILSSRDNNPRWLRMLEEYKNFQKTGENPFYTISVKCYGEKSDAIPTTMYMTFSCFASSESAWVTLLKIHKDGYQWIPETISEPHNGPYSFDFNCAFDIDHDGVLEYYINNSIYHISDGELRMIYKGPFIGDI